MDYFIEAKQEKHGTLYIKQARLEHRGFHSLRHTHASNLIDAEIYPLAVSRRLGHSTIAITIDICSHFSIEKKENDKYLGKHSRGTKGAQFVIYQS